MLIISHYTDTFKLNVYVSQFYFNVTNKVSRYTVSTKVSQWKSNEFDKYPAIHQGFPY